MQKAKINIKINDYIIEEIGIIDNDIIKLDTKEEQITFNLKKLILAKDSKELKITLDFKNETVFYELKEEKSKFSDNLVIFSLTNHDKQVMINYQIENESFLLSINYETI